MGAIIIRREWPTPKKGHVSQALQAMACMHARAWAVKARHGRRAMVKVFTVRFSLAQLNWRQDSALAPVELARTKGTNNEVRLFSSIVHSNGNFPSCPRLRLHAFLGWASRRMNIFHAPTLVMGKPPFAVVNIPRDWKLAKTIC